MLRLETYDSPIIGVRNIVGGRKRAPITEVGFSEENKLPKKGQAIVTTKIVNNFKVYTVRT